MSRTLTLAGWAALVVAAAVLEVAARRAGRGATAAAVVRAVTRHRAGRLLLQAGWLWLGWHLFVRAHRP